MTIVLKRDISKKGCTDEWSCSVEPSDKLFTGIGKSRVEALGSFLSANIIYFGITKRIDIDPEREDCTIVWEVK